jgi:hypothetical protein
MTPAQIPHTLHNKSATRDFSSRSKSSQVIAAVMDERWARQDLNLGPSDYESTALTS